MQEYKKIQAFKNLHFTTNKEDTQMIVWGKVVTHMAGGGCIGWGITNCCTYKPIILMG